MPCSSARKILRHAAALKMDLRFQCQDSEASFTKSLEEDLVRNSCLGLMFFLVGTVWLSISAKAVKVTNHASYLFQWDGHDPRTLYFIGRILQVVLVAAYLVLGFCRWSVGRFKGWNWEYIVVGLTSAILLLSNMCIPWHVAMLWSMDPEYVWGEDVRGTELLNCLEMVLFLIGAAVFVPARVCVLWIAVAFTIVPLATLNLINGSPFPAEAGNILFLLCTLAAFVGFGARRGERTAREEWRAQHRVAHQQEELDARYAAVSHILDCFCEIVVHLGPPPAFEIVEPSPHLAALLMYKEGQTLERSSILSYFASAEDTSLMVSMLQHDWAACLNSASMDNELCGRRVNIHLRDTSGKEIAVTASHTCIRRFEDTPRFIISFAELRDGTNIVMSSIPARTIENQPDSALIVDPPDAQMFVMFSALDFSVVECSSSFSMFCCPYLPGTALTKWLLRSQNQRFYDDFTRHMHDIGYSMLGDTVMQHKCVLKNCDGTKLKADIAIKFRKFASDVVGHCPVMAYAVLTRVRQKNPGQGWSSCTGDNYTSSEGSD